jgi:peptide/nickel transport system permease protein
MSVIVDSSSAPAQEARPGALRLVLKNPLAVAAIAILALMIVVAIIQDWILPVSRDHVSLELTNAPPFTPGHLLGGDRYGRDILSRLISGTREGLLSGLIFTAVALAVGTVLGLIAGYSGRVIDGISSWIFSVLLAAPGVVILFGLYTLINISVPVAMVTLGVISSPTVFYLVRTLTRTVRTELYVDAARVSGLSNVRIIGRHVFLAIKGPLIILAAFLAGGGISLSAGLEFLGLGDHNQPSWGQMLNDAFTNYYIAPWQLIWPGAALGLAIASFILLGNSLRDALEGSYVKPSRRSRQRSVDRLLGPVAASKTLGNSANPGDADKPEPDDTLLAISGLQIAYRNGGGLTTVVEGVSLTVERGEIVGLVGESGSGKTQTVLAALGLLPEQAIVVHGSIEIKGHQVLGLNAREGRRYRRRQVAYVPQEPMSNLDPSFTIGSQVVEGIRAQTGMRSRDAKQLALRTFARVGLRDPEKIYRQYPHQISGGMAQRVLIAGAVACRPELLVADEPTTALDVTVQAEVLDLLRDLQKEMRMGVLIVTHNLGVVADLCDRVAVMRTGKIVEQGPAWQVLLHPHHDYTKALLAAVLDEDTAGPDLTASGVDA